MRQALAAWLEKIAAALLAEPAAAQRPGKTMREQLAEQGLDANGRPASGLAGIDLSIEEVEELNQRSRRVTARPELEEGFLCTVRFRYEDFAGAHSERTVGVSKIDDFYFYGFCHLRQDFRQFAWDRVQGDIVMVYTGEVLSADTLRRRCN